jgi:hypothetical protein
MIVEILKSYYDTSTVLHYSESDDEIQFQLPALIVDRQTAAFRSKATVLNELAISHRLSLLFGRSKYGLPEDFSFAIKSVEFVVESIDTVNDYDVSLRFEIIAKRRDTITALKSTLVTKYGNETRTTVTSFNVLPPALANFVRRSRQFMDYAELKIDRDKAELSTIAANHLRYYPAEADRLSDGKRVDHVPALTLIDLALSINEIISGSASYSNIAAEFLNYTDPRLALDILQKPDSNAVEFRQNDQPVAIVYLTASIPIASETRVNAVTT